MSANDIIGGLLIGGLVGILGVALASCNVNYFPKEGKVQAGYVVPSKLEVELLDLDGNGVLETFLKYENKRYLLLLDEQGKVKVEAYGPNPQTK